MKTHRIAGRIVRFRFDDGPMAGNTFEHSFEADGTVKFRQVGAKDSTWSPGTKYEAESIRDDVMALSYLSSAGYTLTAVLDFKANRLVAFSSNEKIHGMQHGTFEVASPEAPVEPDRRHGHRAQPPR